MAGRTSTTWDRGSRWNHTPVKTIRVPVELANQIMDYAIALDKGEVNDVDFLVAKFIEVKKTQYRRTGLRWNPGVPTWKVFNEFLRWLKVQS